MKKVVTIDKAISIANELHNQEQQIVLVGGCFDLLHIGHITFLEEAKRAGTVLMVMLESDAHIREMKGPNRPVTTQEDRAKILASIRSVDYVITLPSMQSNADYDALVFALKPAIIATTHGDPYRSHKERQAKHIGAKLVDVIMPIQNQSTTKLLHLIEEL